MKWTGAKALIVALTLAFPGFAVGDVGDGSGIRKFKIELSAEAKAKLESKTLRRADSVRLLATFAITGADAGTTGDLILFPTDGSLSGGPEYEGQDSTAGGAIHIPFTIGRTASTGVMQIPFSFTPTGRNGSSIYAKLVFLSPVTAVGSSATSFLFAIDETSGDVSLSDIKAMYRAQAQRFRENITLRSSLIKNTRVLKMNPNLRISDESREVTLPARVTP